MVWRGNLNRTPACEVERERLERSHVAHFLDVLHLHGELLPFRRGLSNVPKRVPRNVGLKAATPWRRAAKRRKLFSSASRWVKVSSDTLGLRPSIMESGSHESKVMEEYGNTIDRPLHGHERGNHRRQSGEGGCGQ
jgi:hypothetical protein